MKAPAKRGRPKMKKGKARTEFIPGFRITRAEWDYIERRRKALGLSISEYMRRAALRGFSHNARGDSTAGEGVTVNVGADTIDQSTGAVLDRHPEYGEDGLDDEADEDGGTTNINTDAREE